MLFVLFKSSFCFSSSSLLGCSLFCSFFKVVNVDILGCFSKVVVVFVLGLLFLVVVLFVSFGGGLRSRMVRFLTMGIVVVVVVVWAGARVGWLLVVVVVSLFVVFVLGVGCWFTLGVGFIGFVVGCCWLHGGCWLPGGCCSLWLVLGWVLFEVWALVLFCWIGLGVVLFLSNTLNKGWFSRGLGWVWFVVVWLGCFLIGLWRVVLG